MPDWPHAPVHRLGDAGSYMVTAATYQQIPLFNSRAKLDLLTEALFAVLGERGIPLQAWAIFPNHYHFIALLRSPKALPAAIQDLHAKTARAVNKVDGLESRQVWFQYWDSFTRSQRSFFARLHYVHANAVLHGVVRRAENYAWCSAGWFERSASVAFRKTIYSYPIDFLKVKDNFTVDPIE